MSTPRYSIIPGAAVDDPQVSDLHLRILTLFGKASDNNGWLQVNQRVIAERTGRSRETINRSIRELVDMGYVRKKARFSGKDGRRLINDYQVVMDRADPRESLDSQGIEAARDVPPCDAHVTYPCDVQITGYVTSGDHNPCDVQTSQHKYDPLLQRPSSSFPNEDQTPPRGTWLPADFEPDLDWAVANGMRPEIALAERAKFLDFWRAKAGVDARKRNWPATWRNWVRRTLERAPGPRARGSPTRRETFADFLNDRAERGSHERDQHAGPTIEASYRRRD